MRLKKQGHKIIQIIKIKNNSRYHIKKANVNLHHEAKALPYVEHDWLKWSHDKDNCLCLGFGSRVKPIVYKTQTRIY